MSRQDASLHFVISFASRARACVRPALHIPGTVQAWLQRLVEGMQATVKAAVRRGARNVAEMGLRDFILGHPAQVALLGLQFQWTADTQVPAVYPSGWLPQKASSGGSLRRLPQEAPSKGSLSR